MKSICLAGKRFSLPLRFASLFALLVIFHFEVAQCEPPHSKRKVGFVLSLTGAWAHFGEAQRHALEMARENHPKLFENISFVYEDCQYQSKNAVTSFKKLRDIDGVDVIFVWGVEPSLALAPLAEASRIPLFVSALDPRAAINRKYVVRTINLAAQHSQKLSEYLVSQGRNRIAVVKSEISFFDVLVDGLKANLSKTQSLTVIDNYLPGQLDFRTTVAKLRRGNYDALGIYLGPDQVAQFYRQLSAQRVRIPTFGATPFQSSTVIRDAGGAMTGAVFAHNYVDEKFRAAYVNKVGDDMQIPWAANAYDFAILMGETLSASELSIPAEKIIEQATGFKKRSGVGGEYAFVDSTKFGKYFRYPIVVYRVDGESYHIVSDDD